MKSSAPHDKLNHVGILSTFATEDRRADFGIGLLVDGGVGAGANII